MCVIRITEAHSSVYYTKCMTTYTKLCAKSIRIKTFIQKVVPDAENFVSIYRNVPKFSDRQVWANSADPDQTAPLIRIYTVCHSVSIVWTHYSMVEPHSSNFRVITTSFLGVRIFRNFTVLARVVCTLYLMVSHLWNRTISPRFSVFRHKLVIIIVKTFCTGVKAKQIYICVSGIQTQPRFCSDPKHFVKKTRQNIVK